jgi:hypothetical protein
MYWDVIFATWDIQDQNGESVFDRFSGFQTTSEEHLVSPHFGERIMYRSGSGIVSSGDSHNVSLSS